MTNPLLFLLALPLATLLHELGHALWPLLKGNSALVTLGIPSPKALARVRLGRLTVVVYPVFFWGGFCHWGQLSRRDNVLAIAAGPVTSLLTLLLALLLVSVFPGGLPGEFGRVLAGVSGFLLLVTVLPVTYPRWYMTAPDGGAQHSDMRNILRLLRAEG